MHFWNSPRSWWRHQMETFSALLAICAGNSPVPGEFPTQKPVRRSFDVFFDLRLNKRLSKQWWGWWFETLSHPLWRHRNVMQICMQTRLALVQIMACCLSVTNPLSEPLLVYSEMDHCQYIPVNFQIHQFWANTFEIVTCKMVAVLSRPQCVNSSLPGMRWQFNLQKIFLIDFLPWGYLNG